MTDTQTISVKIHSYRDKASQAKQVYTAARDSINADNTRTTEWKREQTRAALATLARELEQTEQAEKAYIAATTKELEHKVFGIEPGQDVLAYRDAQDRVRALHWNDEEGAVDLYRQAERSSDTTLMQALSQRPVTAGWARVQEAHAAQNHRLAARIWAHLSPAHQGKKTKIGPASYFRFVFASRTARLLTRSDSKGSSRHVTCPTA